MTWYGLDHRYITDVIARAPEHFVGTGIVPAVADVALPSPDRTMVALSKKGVYAFRVRGKSTRPPVGGGPQWMDYPGFDKMFEAGAEHRLALSFLVHPHDLPEVDRMCARFPETPVIIDHLGGVNENSSEEYLQALLHLARHKKVMVKVGAFYGLGRTPPYLSFLPVIRRVVDAFGPERCMWESDAPFPPGRPAPYLVPNPPHSYKAAISLIRDHADFLSSSDTEQILVKTAEDFFFKR
jgi:predicted TIM-barrel fold metal-dependent hydrolase